MQSNANAIECQYDTCSRLRHTVRAHERRFSHAPEVLLLLGVVGSDEKRRLINVRGVGFVLGGQGGDLAEIVGLDGSADTAAAWRAKGNKVKKAFKTKKERGAGVEKGR
jgi:hypothetical protein